MFQVFKRYFFRKYIDMLSTKFVQASDTIAFLTVKFKSLKPQFLKNKLIVFLDLV